MAPIGDKLLIVRLPNDKKPLKLPQRSATALDRFSPTEHSDFRPVNVQRMRQLCKPKPDTLSAAADTFSQFDRYVRSGESTRDSAEYLRGELEGVRELGGHTLQTLRHPIKAAGEFVQGVANSGPVLVEFSRNSEHITAGAVRHHVAQLTQDDPRLAGRAFGKDLYTVGTSMAPLPSISAVLSRVRKLRPGKFSNSHTYRISGEQTGRNAAKLRPSDRKAAMDYLAEHYPTPGGGIHFQTTRQTQYCTLTDSLHIAADALPHNNPGAGTASANRRVSLKGCLAHEMEGHRKAFLAGKTQPVRHLEEAQASIRAARFGKGLSPTERTTLLRDAISRLQAQGIKIRDVKESLWIHK